MSLNHEPELARVSKVASGLIDEVNLQWNGAQDMRISHWLVIGVLAYSDDDEGDVEREIPVIGSETRSPVMRIGILRSAQVTIEGEYIATGGEE